MSLYVDASAIIYSVEGAPGVKAVVLDRMRQVVEVHGLLATSRLSRLEVFVKPLRDRDSGLMTKYENVFRSDPLLVLDVDDTTIETATGIRAEYGFKTPDAIHLATAVVAKADAFLTGDQRLTRFNELKVELVWSD